MKKKLQIFVSSTYSDLLTERQAAVEAILRAGHIPAGMELFAAGDKSQLETIYRWIDETDIFMLILGGRYGSVDKETGKSYTQLEYEYALATGKRFFGVVLTEAAIDQKVGADGRSVIEKDHQKELNEFRQVVMSKICRMVDDHKDIKLAIHETILEFLREYSFDGWVSGKNVAAMEEMTIEMARLTRENTDLRAEMQSARANKTPAKPPADDFESILALLNSDYLTYTQSGKEPVRSSVAQWFYLSKTDMVTGISNSYNMSHFHNFLFFQLSPHLSVHGLTADQKVAGVQWRTIKTTPKGNDFLVYIQKKIATAKQANGEAESAAIRPAHGGTKEDVAKDETYSSSDPVATKSLRNAPKKVMKTTRTRKQP